MVSIFKVPVPKEIPVKRTAYIRRGVKFHDSTRGEYDGRISEDVASKILLMATFNTLDGLPKPKEQTSDEPTLSKENS